MKSKLVRPQGPEQGLPFDVKVPTAANRKAVVELEAGKGRRHGSGDELFEDLGI